MMKFEKDNKYFKIGLTAFCVISACLTFYYILFHNASILLAMKKVSNVFMPVLWGFVIAYIITPIMNYIENRIFKRLYKRLKVKETRFTKNLNRSISMILSFFVVGFIVYILFSMLVSQIVPSITNIINNSDTYRENFIVWINKIFEDNPSMRDSLLKMINQYSNDMELWFNETLLKTTSNIIKTVSLSVIGVIKVLWNFILGFVISIYFLFNKERFAGQSKKCVFALFKNDTANIIINNFKYTHNTFSGFLSGKVLDSIIIGLLCFIGTSILQTPYAALVSVIIGVTNVIPFFGPYLGAIPSVILIFLVDISHPLNSIYFALFILVLQQLDGNVIGPKILGNSTGLSSFWVIFSITVFGGFFGVPGMIIGVPTFAVIYGALRSFMNIKLMKKNLPTESTEYITAYKIENNTLVKHQVTQMDTPNGVQTVDETDQEYGKSFTTIR